MNDAWAIFLFIIFVIVFLCCCVCCCAICSEDDQLNQNESEPPNAIRKNLSIFSSSSIINKNFSSTALVTREILFIVIDEGSLRRELQQESQGPSQIPEEYSNIRPEETVIGWRQGSLASEIPSDARVPRNAQPPTILSDD